MTIAVQGAVPAFAHIHHAHSWHVDCCEAPHGEDNEPTPHDDCEYEALGTLLARLAPVRDTLPDLPDVSAPAVIFAADRVTAAQPAAATSWARGPPDPDGRPPLQWGTGTSRVLRVSHALIF
jgi:hypothetical protein